jgi:hypothetical protein
MIWREVLSGHAASILVAHFPFEPLLMFLPNLFVGFGQIDRFRRAAECPTR